MSKPNKAKDSIASLGLVASVRNWFETAKPEETRSVRDIQVQTGVHFEEVHEMLQEINGLTPETDLLLAKAKQAMHELANHFKESQEVIFFIDNNNHIRYLDALCDQMVTATGVAHFMGYDVNGAFTEVDESNWSKFMEDPDSGKKVCVLDSNGKIAKGPNYFKADLSQFI